MLSNLKVFIKRKPKKSAKRDKTTSGEYTIPHPPHIPRGHSTMSVPIGVHHPEDPTYAKRSTEKGGGNNADKTHYQEKTRKEGKLYEVLPMINYDPDMMEEEKRIACYTIGETNDQMKSEMNQ